MDASFITPFFASVQNVFSTMLQLAVTIGEPRIKEESATSYDVSGIVGMSGDVVGSVVLSFPQASAQRIVALFSGSEMAPDSTDFADAVGELVNMISGGAKGMFTGGRKVSISCPSVVVGRNHTVARQKDTPCVVIPCTTDCGEFAIEIAIREAASGAASKPAAAAA